MQIQCEESDRSPATYSAVELVTPADPSTITALRHRAADFATEQGVADGLVADIALAVSEAVTNVVRYAYGPSGGTVELAASTDPEWLEICVRNSGDGFSPGPSEGLGLGLTLIADLCSNLAIAQESTGIEVKMRWALSEV